MNIGWDMVDIPPNKDGTFEFVSRWLCAVAAYPQGHTHICYANAAFRRAAIHPTLDAIDWHIAGDWAGGYQLHREEFYLRNRRQIRKQVDILVSVYRPPLAWNGKSIAIVLDCTKERFPTVRGLKNHLVAGIRDYGARHARRWLAISEWTRLDAARLRGYDPARIRSAGIPLAEFAGGPLVGNNSSARIPFGIIKKFAFYCSAISAHKNHMRLIRAWKKAFPNREVLLVLAGRLLPGTQPEIMDSIRRAEEEGFVRMLGLVGDMEREQLYAASDFVVYPSLCEGFGMPVLEAMRYSKPVLTSSGTSTEEVGGDAVLLCDPTDEDGMVIHLRRMASDGVLRERLRTAIPGRLARYSQKNVARELNEGIEYLAGLE